MPKPALVKSKQSKAPGSRRKQNVRVKRSAPRGKSPASLKLHARKCVIKKAQRKHKAVLRYLRKNTPSLAHWERMVRIGDFIKLVADAKKTMTEKAEWWGHFAHWTKFHEKYEGNKAQRDQLRKKMEAVVKKLLAYYDDPLRNDLAKHHGAIERFNVMDGLMEGIAMLPFKSVQDWFDKNIFTTMYGEKSPWDKVLTWNRFKDVQGAYTGIILKFAPRIALKTEAQVLKVVDKLFSGKHHAIAGKPVLNQARWKTFNKKWNDIFNLNRHGLSVSQGNVLVVKEFDVSNHVRHIHTLNGIIATFGFVASMRAWQKDPKLKDAVGAAASACGIAEAASMWVAAGKLSSTPLASLPSAGALSKGVPLAGAGARSVAKALGRVGAILGFGVSAMDTRDTLLAGDYDAAGWAAVGMVGAMLAMTGVGTPYGVAVMIIAGIGYALTKDSPMVTFAKKSPYGTAVAASVSPKNSLEGEKYIKKVMESLRKTKAVTLRTDARKLNREAQELRRKAAAERAKVDNIPSTPQSRDGGVAPNPDMVNTMLKTAAAYDKEADAKDKRAANFKLKAHFFWGVGKK